MSHEAESPASVLIVDDTIENLRILSSMLEKSGYEVRPVTNGRQALQVTEHDPPDLILLDINMPEMDGYEVCRRLKEMDGAKDVPVIFLTASMDTEDKLRAFDAGGIDYVAKPFRFEEVLARVKTHVALRRAQKAAAESYNRLRALEQLRDDLVNMIVHDLRSPLQTLVFRLTLLQRSAAALDEVGQDDLKIALESGNEVVRMVNDVLDVSRLEAGQMPVKRAGCDLTRMANDVCVALGSIHPERQIEIESPGAVNVNCDGALVRRVMENLVSNAIKHTPAGTRTRVSIAGRDDHVRIAVHDEGSGVPPDMTETIFEKFGTVAGRQDRDYESVGLGLAFCRLAVEAHGGHIGVDPGVPVGSTFWFELPAQIMGATTDPAVSATLRPTTI